MKLGDTNLKEVQTYKYLGITLNKQGNSTEEIIERIHKSRKVRKDLNFICETKE